MDLEDKNEVTIPCKVQRCVFCAITITSDVFPVPQEGIDTGQVFIDSLAVISDSLNVPGILKFSNRAVWQLLGCKNFIDLVCCNDCYTQVSNLVDLHQIILTTQASLKESTERLKSTVLNSEKLVRNRDLKYSLNACVELRQELLENIQPENNAIRKQANPTRPGPLSRKRHHGTREHPGSHSVETSQTSTAHNFPSVCVMLERIDALSVETATGSSYIHEKDEFEDESSKKKRRPGRPRKIEKVEKATRPDPLGESDSVNETSESLLKYEYNYYPTSSESGNDSDDTDDEYKPEENKTMKRKPGRPRTRIENTPKQDPGVRRSRGRPRKDPNYIPDDDSKQLVRTEETTEVIKRKGGPGRPSKNRYNHKPTYAVDLKLGVFVYDHVKFQRILNAFYCLHPGCKFSQPISQFGAEQLAFQKIRYHINKGHRLKYRGTHPPKKKKDEHWYWCYSCDTQYPTPVELKAHRGTHHFDGPRLPAFCEVCGDTTQPKGLISHLLTHKNPEEKEDAIEHNKKRLMIRERIKASNEHFPCDVCSKTFLTKAEVQSHKATHIPIEMRRKWVCEICGSRLASAGGLEYHKRKVHLKEIPRSLVCHICSKSYMSCDTVSFGNHMRAHSGEKPFQCRYCGKGFHASEGLTRHEKLHNDVPIPCEFCSNIYKNAKYLKRHHIKHHPDLIEHQNYEITKRFKSHPDPETFIGPVLVYPCEPCEHQYRYRSMLVAHLKGKHNMQLASNKDYPSMWTYQDEYGGNSVLYDPQLGGNPRLVNPRK